jgi:hypothetical protein
MAEASRLAAELAGRVSGLPGYSAEWRATLVSEVAGMSCLRLVHRAGICVHVGVATDPDLAPREAPRVTDERVVAFEAMRSPELVCSLARRMDAEPPELGYWHLEYAGSHLRARGSGFDLIEMRRIFRPRPMVAAWEAMEELGLNHLPALLAREDDEPGATLLVLCEGTGGWLSVAEMIKTSLADYLLGEVALEESGSDFSAEAVRLGQMLARLERSAAACAPRLKRSFPDPGPPSGAVASCGPPSLYSVARTVSGVMLTGLPDPPRHPFSTLERDVSGLAASLAKACRQWAAELDPEKRSTDKARTFAQHVWGAVCDGFAAEASGDDLLRSYRTALDLARAAIGETF